MWRMAGTLILVGLMAAGCAGSGEETGVSSMPPVAMDSGPATGAEAKQPVAPERSIITTAQMSIRVEDVPGTVRSITDAVTAHDGVIDYQDFSDTGEGGFAQMTVRVPAESLEELITTVSAFGRVQQVSRQASDVTQQRVDLDARIGALEASIERLRDLLDQTTNVADLVAVETELANRQAEVDSLTAQRDYLANQVAMSTLSISIQPTVLGATATPGFADGLRNGIATLITLAGALVTAVGFMLPFAAIALLVLGIGWLLWRTWRRRQP